MTKQELKNEITEKVKSNDYDYFYDLSMGVSQLPKSDYKTVYEANYGDGNEYIICIEFPTLDLFVQLEGTYSSYDSPDWDSVVFAMPFEFTETRYRKATLEYQRDKTITNIIGE